MNQKYLIRTLFVFSILLLLINLFHYNEMRGIIEIVDLNSSIIVSPKTGFDVSSDSIKFGGVTRGSSSIRKITFTNNNNFPVYLQYYGLEEYGKFISPNKLRFDSLEVRAISVFGYAPKEIDFGEYSGKVRFVIRKDI